MTAQTVTRVIEVDVRASKDAAEHIRQIAGGMNNLEETGRRTSTSLSGLMNTAKGFIGLFVAGFAHSVVMEFIALSDQAKILEARMKMVTGSNAAAKDSFLELTRISIAQGRELESTSKLYEKATRNAETLGITMRGVSVMTEGFAASLRLSGSGTQEANAAMIQFGQVLASGRFQGDEFRSMMENNAVFMFELAKSAGVTMKALREMSKDGKLDAEFLREALYKLGDDGKNMLQRMIEKADELPKTFAQAKEGVKTAMVDILNALGTTATQAEGMFTRMLKAVQSGMSEGARSIRDEAEIQGKILAEFGKANPQLDRDKGLDVDGRVNAKLTDRRIEVERQLTEKNAALQRRLAQGVAEDDFMATMLATDVRRYKAEVAAINAILERKAKERESRESGALIASGWKGVKDDKNKPKGWEVKDDPIEDALEKIREADSALDERVSGVGKHLRAAFRALEDTTGTLPAEYFEFMSNKLKTEAAALDSKELEVEFQKLLTGALKKSRENSEKEAQKEIDAYMDNIEKFLKLGRRRNPRAEINHNLEGFEKAIEGATSTKTRDELIAARKEYLETALSNLETTKDKMISIGQSMAEHWERAFDRATDSLLSFSKTNKEILKDLVTDMLREWAKLEFKAATRPLMEAGKTWLTDTLTTMMKSADGSAFGQGGVQMFAAGGVVNSPTGFSYGAGGTKSGVMGEAGPEAIMPLRRGADGKLGVGSAPVTVNVYNNSSNTKTTQSEQVDSKGNREIIVTVEDIVERALGLGKFDRTLSGAFGVNRKGAR